LIPARLPDEKILAGSAALAQFLNVV